MTYTAISEKASAKVRSMTIQQLVDTFVLTGIQIDTGKHDENIYTVRGWLMDEIEKRDPDGFNAWVEAFEDDDGLYNYIHF